MYEFRLPVVPTMDETRFYTNGVRRVSGPLGVVEYDAEGNARFLMRDEAIPRQDRSAVIRWDLAA